MVTLRENLTPLGHDIQAAVELAQRCENSTGWPRITPQLRRDAKAKRALISRADRVIFIDGCGRVSVGKVVAEHKARTGKQYAVVQRMYRKSIKNCRSNYTAVPRDRIVC